MTTSPLDAPDDPCEDDDMEVTVTEGAPVVIVRGRHTNEPGIVLDVHGKTADVLLGRTGDAVTVRTSSLDVYS